MGATTTLNHPGTAKPKQAHVQMLENRHRFIRAEAIAVYRNAELGELLLDCSVQHLVRSWRLGIFPGERLQTQRAARAFVKPVLQLGNESVYVAFQGDGRVYCSHTGFEGSFLMQARDPLRICRRHERGVQLEFLEALLGFLHRYA